MWGWLCVYFVTMFVFNEGLFGSQESVLNYRGSLTFSQRVYTIVIYRIARNFRG